MVGTPQATIFISPEKQIRPSMWTELIKDTDPAIASSEDNQILAHQLQPQLVAAWVRNFIAPDCWQPITAQ